MLKTDSTPHNVSPPTLNMADSSVPQLTIRTGKPLMSQIVYRRQQLHRRRRVGI